MFGRADDRYVGIQGADRYMLYLMLYWHVRAICQDVITIVRVGTSSTDNFPLSLGDMRSLLLPDWDVPEVLVEIHSHTRSIWELNVSAVPRVL